MSDTSSAWVADADPVVPGCDADECCDIDLSSTASLTDADTLRIGGPPTTEHTVRMVRAACHDITLLRRLGMGGCAGVYLGYDHKDKESVAVKIGNPGEGTTASILAEQAVMWRLSAMQTTHGPIAPRLHVAGELRDQRRQKRRFMSMDLCDGSEDDIGERIGVPSLRYAYWAIAETADLVHRAHTRFGFVHADLKPANIMLRRVRLPGQTTRHAIQRLLSDWAFAFDVRTPRRQRPQDGMLFACTPQYSPPEQLGIDRVRDRRSDMYAFGGTAFALLTGKPPNSQIGNMLDMIARKDEIECMTPEDDAILRSCVPGHVADFVGRLLLKNPALRPSSAEARDFFLSLHLATNGTWAIPSNRKAQVFSVRSYLQNVPRAERHVRLPDLTNMADPDELAAALAERFHHDDTGRVYALPQRVSMETPTRPSDAAQPEPQPTTAADENVAEPLDSITILYPASSSPVS